MSSSPLPIDEVLPELIAALRAGPAAVLIAPTGAGETRRGPRVRRGGGVGGGGAVRNVGAAADRGAGRGAPHDCRGDRRGGVDVRPRGGVPDPLRAPGGAGDEDPGGDRG